MTAVLMSLPSNWFGLLVDFNELLQHKILCVWLLVLGIITVRFVCDIMYKLCVCACAHAHVLSTFMCVNAYICDMGGVQRKMLRFLLYYSVLFS